MCTVNFDKLWGKYLLKDCVRDRKRVFVFLLHAMQYPVIVCVVNTCYRAKNT